MPAPTTTAQRVFDITMGLIDEVNENSGETDTADTREYKVRTLLILNALRGELYPYSDTYNVETAGERPIVSVIQDFDTPIDLDDYICQSVMPYGLAAHLLLDENPDVAAFFNQRYAELLSEYRRGIPAASEDIQELYGGIEYGQFARWD